MVPIPRLQFRVETAFLLWPLGNEPGSEEGDVDIDRSLDETSVSPLLGQ